MRKTRDKASLLPKLYVTAIDELLCLLDGFLIAGTFDDLRRLRDVMGWVAKKDAVLGHDGHSHPQNRRQRNWSLSRRNCLERTDDASLCSLSDIIASHCGTASEPSGSCGVASIGHCVRLAGNLPMPPLCPNCSRPMTVARTIAATSIEPELNVYRCNICSVDFITEDHLTIAGTTVRYGPH
jgi:hypothetical protein